MVLVTWQRRNRGLMEGTVGGAGHWKELSGAEIREVVLNLWVVTPLGLE